MVPPDSLLYATRSEGVWRHQVQVLPTCITKAAPVAVTQEGTISGEKKAFMDSIIIINLFLSTFMHKNVGEV
jgi:hypothetical protein